MPYTTLPPPSFESIPPGSRHRRHDSDFLVDPLLITNTSNHSNHDDDYYNHNHNPISMTTVRQRGRILDRDADFYQSRGRWSGVELLPRASGRRNRSSLSVGIHPSRRRVPCCGNCKRVLRQWMPRLWEDWFHTLAYQRTLVLMSILFITYFAIVAGFASIYLLVSLLGAKPEEQPDGSVITKTFCDMDVTNHMEALYFSLSTMTTIGYGVSDYYFGGCWTPLLLVLVQVCTAITFDACAVGLLFTRLSRGRKRGKTVVVSNQAVVQVVQGTPYFMLRVGELRRFPLIDASVKLFCIRHERLPRLYPSITAANIAAAAEGDTHRTVSSSSTSPQQQRQSNDNNNRDETNALQSIPTTTTNPQSKGNVPPPAVVPVDTTHFVTRHMKVLHPDDDTTTHSNHILMSLPQVMVHRMDDTSPLVPPAEWYDARGRHHQYPPHNPDRWLDMNQKAVQDFWNDRAIEIVVLVEGTDELTGAAIQARHSYSAASSNCNNHTNNNNNMSDQEMEEEEADVVWNRAFASCILPYRPEDALDYDDDVESITQSSRYRRNHYPVCTVDFERFHDTVPVPRDCFASPYLPS